MSSPPLILQIQLQVQLTGLTSLPPVPPRCTPPPTGIPAPTRDCPPPVHSSPPPRASPPWSEWSLTLMVSPSCFKLAVASARSWRGADLSSTPRPLGSCPPQPPAPPAGPALSSGPLLPHARGSVWGTSLDWNQVFHFYGFGLGVASTSRPGPMPRLPLAMFPFILFSGSFFLSADTCVQLLTVSPSCAK